MRTRALREILSLATEDYYGLWEVRGLLRKISPGIEDSTIRQLAADTVGELFERGWVGLFTGNLGTNDVRPVTREDVARILREAVSWDPPTDAAENLAIASTPEGDAVYFSERPADNDTGST